MLNFNFSSTEVLLGGAILITFLMGIAYMGRYYFRHLTIDTDASASRTKYDAVDVFRLQPTLMRVGFICALSFTFLAFNWTQFEARDLPDYIVIEELAEIETAPPITQHEPPPPPPPPPPTFEASDDLLVDTVTFQSGDAHASDEIIPSPIRKAPPKPSVVPPPPPLKTDVDPFHKIVEKMPMYGGCEHEVDKTLRRQCADHALMSFIGKAVHYPALATETGVEGTAVVRFVVEKDGSLSNIEVVRDPGAGLGKEAERVVQLLSQKGQRWEPGEQRGRKVRVQFNLPIKFKLE